MGGCNYQNSYAGLSAVSLGKCNGKYPVDANCNDMGYTILIGDCTGQKLACANDAVYGSVAIGNRSLGKLQKMVNYSVYLGAAVEGGAADSPGKRLCCSCINVMAGYFSGNSAAGSTNNTYGHGNTYIGSRTAGKRSHDNYDTLIGYTAGCCNCANWGKVAIGTSAGNQMKHPTGLTAVGGFAAYTGWYPYYSVMVGWKAAQCSNYACYSVYIGSYAGCCSYGSRCNTVIGSGAGIEGSYMCRQVIIGANAGMKVKCSGWSGNCYSTIVGRCSANLNISGYNVYGCFFRSEYLGAFVRPYATGSSNYEIVIGYLGLGAGSCKTVIGNSSTTNTYLCGAVSKGGGSFRIKHPNPKKKDKMLFHSFVESPTAGDNVYRWSVDTCECRGEIKLPDYYKYLNENNMAWVKPVDHFGRGYAEVDSSGDNLVICSNKDGCYNVLLIGTRCDDHALQAWKGVEQDD
jgi:hypothetical protein